MNFIRRFMYGRYGVDNLSLALIILSMIITLTISVLNIFFDVFFLVLLDWIPLLYAFYRMLSKNIQKRRIENEKFLKVWNPIKSKIIFRITKWKNRKQYKYLKCPNCKANLRVPRLGGKKISVNCKMCNIEFTTKA